MAAGRKFATEFFVELAQSESDDGQSDRPESGKEEWEAGEGGECGGEEDGAARAEEVGDEAEEADEDDDEET